MLEPASSGLEKEIDDLDCVYYLPLKPDQLSSFCDRVKGFLATVQARTRSAAGSSLGHKPAAVHFATGGAGGSGFPAGGATQDNHIEGILPEQSFCHMIGRTAEMQQIFDLLRHVGPSNASVLVLGESGTGKELVARAIHDLSRRADGPFLAINCGALPKDILENELFGHEKGAYTGSGEAAQGIVEQSHGGTLFLDEIGEMAPDLQVRLLRMLETRTIRRLGGKKDIPVDLRIVAATHQDPVNAVRTGRLRQDLFYRLAVIEIRLPALRERNEDLDLLINHFLVQFATENGYPTPVLAFEAGVMLHNHSWPGNIRELRNLLERSVILGAGASQLLPEHFPAEMMQLQNQPQRRQKDHIISRSVDESDLWSDNSSATSSLISTPQSHSRGGVSDLSLYRHSPDVVDCLWMAFLFFLQTPKGIEVMNYFRHSVPPTPEFKGLSSSRGSLPDASQEAF